MTIEQAEDTLLKTLRGLVAKYRISSPFGNRIHPITGKPQFHNGIDISTPVGTEILIDPALPCRIWWDAQYGGGLSCVCEGKRYRYGFAHLDRVWVSDGKIVLHTGNTGVSTGPHLHLTLSQGGSFIDPLSVLR